MPMIEITIPKGTFTAETKEQLVRDLTKVLLKWEGAPDNAQSNSIAWAYVNEVEEYAVGGRLQTTDDRPRYRIVDTVPQGALDDRRKAGLVEEVTRIVLEAEGAPFDLVNAQRVWCIIKEVTDGNWGGAGRIMRFADILNFVGADAARRAEAGIV